MKIGKTTIIVLTVVSVACVYFAATRFFTLGLTVFAYTNQEFKTVVATGLSAGAADRILGPVYRHVTQLSVALLVPFVLWLSAFIVQSCRCRKLETKTVEPKDGQLSSEAAPCASPDEVSS